MSKRKETGAEQEELHDLVLLGSCGGSQVQQALDALRRACAGEQSAADSGTNWLLARALRPFTLATPDLREAFLERENEGAAGRVCRLLDSLDEQLRRGGATWDDLYHLEKLMLEVATEEELRRRKIELITDFNLYAGPTLKAKYQGYAAGLYQQPFPGKSELEGAKQTQSHASTSERELSASSLRHECLFLQHLIHDILTLRPHQEQKRVDINGVLLSCTGGLVLAFGLAGLVFFRFSTPAEFPFVVLILWAGTLGAYISSTMRLQDSAREGMMILNTTRHARGTGAFFSSILLGAGAALVSYLMLLAGFGAISPDGESARSTEPFWRFLSCCAAE